MESNESERDPDEAIADDRVDEIAAANQPGGQGSGGGPYGAGTAGAGEGPGGGVFTDDESSIGGGERRPEEAGPAASDEGR